MGSGRDWLRHDGPVGGKTDVQARVQAPGWNVLCLTFWASFSPFQRSARTISLGEKIRLPRLCLESSCGDCLLKRSLSASSGRQVNPFFDGSPVLGTIQPNSK